MMDPYTRSDWDVYTDVQFIVSSTTTSTTTPSSLRNLDPDAYMECL